MGISKKEFIIKKYEDNFKVNEDFYNEELNEIVLSLIKTRKEKNMTQKELAKKVGVSCNTISRIETLTVCPTLPVLLKILKALDLKLKLMHE